MDERSERIQRRFEWPVLAAGLLVLLVAAAIAWDAGERHYDNCVAAAVAANPLALTAADRQDLPSGWDQYRNDSFFDSAPEDVAAKAAQVQDRPRERREAAVEGCSRLPWCR